MSTSSSSQPSKPKPTASAKHAKRKPDGGGPGGDSDSDDEGAAKALFFSNRAKQVKKEATRIIKTGGGASVPTVTVKGTVVSAKVTAVASAKGGSVVPKLECTIVATEIRANNAPDILRTGVGGFDFLIPTRKAPKVERDAEDDGPESGGKKKKDVRETTPPRTLAIVEGHKTILSSVLSRVSFYTTSGAGDVKEGMDTVVPGMNVEVTGVVANLSPDGNTLYLNASTVVPLFNSVPQGASAKYIVDAFLAPAVAESAALKLSMAVGGFIGAKELREEQYIQATYFVNKFGAIKSGAIAACNAKAMGLRGEMGPEGENMALVMDAHAQRISSFSAEEIAGGRPLFTPAIGITADRPLYYAPVVCIGSHPGFAQPSLLSDLFDKKKRDALPETYCAAEVTDVIQQGAAINVALKLTFIGSKSAATVALKSGKDPTISSDGACLGIKLSARELPTITGVLGEAKSTAFAKDLLSYADMGFVAGISPRSANEQGISCTFPSGWALDFVPSLTKVTAIVSDTFIKEHLMGGGAQYVREEDGLAVIKDKEGGALSVALPNLLTHGYCEILNLAGFKLGAKTPPNLPNKTYRIWFTGIVDMIADDPEINTSVAAGEKAVLAAAAAVPGGVPAADFLLSSSLLYCVAQA